MNIQEQNLYLTTTKSIVDCFEQFLNHVGKHNDVLSDAELINSMTRISKKLQTVMNKWETKLVKFKTPDVDSESNDKSFSSELLLLDDEKINKHRASTIDEPKPGCSKDLEDRNFSKEQSVMLKFEGINERLILGAGGFHVEELSTGFWKCNACNATNLPLYNLLSHINGKNHKKKIGFNNGN